ncbi:hypothetical protein ACGFZB_04575 [Streptomyces cinerochromogenes]|uniref:Uncharacterized protein n=1 Tax=Streptomyces cinerochromogenes TaxID=66422 RepID=A0ABW7B1Y4_9ACTN
MLHHLVRLLLSFAVLVHAGHRRIAAALYAVLCTSVVWLRVDDASGPAGLLGGNLCTWVAPVLLPGLPMLSSGTTGPPWPAAPAPRPPRRAR